MLAGIHAKDMAVHRLPRNLEYRMVDHIHRLVAADREASTVVIVASAFLTIQKSS